MMPPLDAHARDAFFMREALDEAKKGQGRTSPNPLVGCVIVKDNAIIARGFHQQAGSDHAEAAALRIAGEAARGAEVFVTLEPCAHHGRTPPCARALTNAGVARVVAGMIDPDPRVQGRGMAILHEAGIATTVGVLQDECEAINEAFLIRTKHRRPHVTLKLAGSLDGRIATRTGHSQWITGEPARERVHHMRNLTDAIVTGAGTALADRPALTTRLPGVEGTRSPHRFLLDSQLRVPPEGPLFDTRLAPTTVLCTDAADASRVHALQARGVSVIVCPADTDGRVPLDALLQAVHAQDCSTLMVEGGAELAAAFIEARLVDRLALFVAPILIGGREALPLVAGTGVATIGEALRATSMRMESIGDDILLHAVFDDALRA